MGALLEWILLLLQCRPVVLHWVAFIHTLLLAPDRLADQGGQRILPVMPRPRRNFCRNFFPVGNDRLDAEGFPFEMVLGVAEYVLGISIAVVHTWPISDPEQWRLCTSHEEPIPGWARLSSSTVVVISSFHPNHYDLALHGRDTLSRSIGIPMDLQRLHTLARSAVRCPESLPINWIVYQELDRSVRASPRGCTRLLPTSDMLLALQEDSDIPQSVVRAILSLGWWGSYTKPHDLADALHRARHNTIVLPPTSCNAFDPRDQSANVLRDFLKEHVLVDRKGMLPEELQVVLPYIDTHGVIFTFVLNEQHTFWYFPDSVETTTGHVDTFIHVLAAVWLEILQALRRDNVAAIPDDVDQRRWLACHPAPQFAFPLCNAWQTWDSPHKVLLSLAVYYAILESMRDPGDTRLRGHPGLRELVSVVALVVFRSMTASFDACDETCYRQYANSLCQSAFNKRDQGVRNKVLLDLYGGYLLSLHKAENWSNLPLGPWPTERPTRQVQKHPFHCDIAGTL